VQKKLGSKRCGSGEVLNQFGQFTRLRRFLKGILLLILFHKAIQAFSLMIMPSYSAPLTWCKSPDSRVVGYWVYYGTTSRKYSNRIDVGNVTAKEILGLSSGVTYFFTVTSYDSAGLESPFSEEIRFVPGTPTIHLSGADSGRSVLTVKGLIGHTYEIQATQDFKTWIPIGLVILGASATVNFDVKNAVNLQHRFYRTRDVPP
jgi:hypothetical protein